MRNTKVAHSCSSIARPLGSCKGWMDGGRQESTNEKVLLIAAFTSLLVGEANAYVVCAAGLYRAGCVARPGGYYGYHPYARAYGYGYHPYGYHPYYRRW
jgi:hypothetical protein